MAKVKSQWKCNNCGCVTLQWYGQCPDCKAWNTLENYSPKAAGKSHTNTFSGAHAITDVNIEPSKPFTTSLDELDRVLGGGLHPGASLLIGGEPGIGKSTLLLQICAGVAQNGVKTLYASGEESLSQIKMRAKRINALSPNLLAISTNQVDDVTAALQNFQPALLVADSVQTLLSSNAEGLAGNISQTRTVASELTDICRRQDCAAILVGHVTKDGILAGPRLLEHLVDTVVSLEGDRSQIFRLLRIYKNRFGSNEELLVFKMDQDGMKLVHDPSTFFLEDRDPALPGAALVMALDGNRPLAVEVQALVTKSYTNFPRRVALGIDQNRLNLLLAVLEKRLKLNLSQVDVYAKLGGGLRLQDPAIDLGLVAAILSSYYETPLPERAIFWSEVDLNGQIRPSSSHSIRLKQSARLHFTPVTCASQENFNTKISAGMKQSERPNVSLTNIIELPKLLFQRTHVK